MLSTLSVVELRGLRLHRLCGILQIKSSRFTECVAAEHPLSFSCQGEIFSCVDEGASSRRI